MKVLVVHGSKRGGTEGLAHTVANALVESGHDVDVRRAHEVDELEEWDAVIVGGALYLGRWTRRARRFVERHEDELQRMPVWFFSSGPLDDSASQGDIAPTPQVRKLMDRVHARGHVTFGGRLEASAKGFMAKVMVKQGFVGDWRDMERVEAWGRTVGAALAAAPQPRAHARTTSGQARRRVRHLLAALCLFTGLTAAAGGLELIIWRAGASWLPAPEEALRHTPFSDYLIPGLLLLLVVASSNLVSGVLALRRHRWGEIAAFVGGGAITVWIVTEMLMLRSLHWLQLTYLAIGLVTMAAALWLWLSRRALVRSHNLRPPTLRPDAGEAIAC